MSIATADVTGDGLYDYVIAPSSPSASTVLIINGATGVVAGSFNAFPSYRGGINVAAADINGDGRLDILVVGFPGQGATWFENPGASAKTDLWKAHKALNEVSGESPDFEDITGDGKPELICINGGR